MYTLCNYLLLTLSRMWHYSWRCKVSIALLVLNGPTSEVFSIFSDNSSAVYAGHFRSLNADVGGEQMSGDHG